MISPFIFRDEPFTQREDKTLSTLNFIKERETTLLRFQSAPLFSVFPSSSMLTLWVLTLLVSTLSIPVESFGCLWDKDTIQVEKKRIPNALQLITGHFPYHSKMFYEWRVKDRLDKLAQIGWEEDKPLTETLKTTLLTSKHLHLLDDLMVAFDKLDQTARGVKIARSTLTLQPQRYESLANLGTLLIHQGQFQEGLKYIKEAIKVNPDAHFGREVIQQHLVEYVIERRKKQSKTLPLRRDCVHPKSNVYRDPYLESFDWINGLPVSKKRTKKKRKKKREKKQKDRYLPPKSEYTCLVISHRCGGFCEYLEKKNVTREAGIKGVMGMMRFGQFRHPILLEVFGDLLLSQSSNQLAARAYLRAAEAVIPEAKLSSDQRLSKRFETRIRQQKSFRHPVLGYLSLATLSLVGHRFGLSWIESELIKELKRAERFTQKVAKNEKKWIERGGDVDRKFERKYLTKKRKKRRKTRKKKKSK